MFDLFYVCEGCFSSPSIQLVNPDRSQHLKFRAGRDLKNVCVSLRPSSVCKTSFSPVFCDSRSETKPDCRDDGAAEEIEGWRGGERKRVALLSLPSSAGGGGGGLSESHTDKMSLIANGGCVMVCLIKTRLERGFWGFFLASKWNLGAKTVKKSLNLMCVPVWKDISAKSTNQLRIVSFHSAWSRCRFAWVHLEEQKNRTEGQSQPGCGSTQTAEFTIRLNVKLQLERPTTPTAWAAPLRSNSSRFPPLWRRDKRWIKAEKKHVSSGQMSRWTKSIWSTNWEKNPFNRLWCWFLKKLF